MISILFFVSYWPLIWCTDWCEIIAPNKTYKGLSIYNRYDSSGLRQNWMRNKEGSMWKVNFTFDRNGPLDFIMDDTIETFLKRDVIQMFSISYKRQDIYYDMNCEMYSNRLECVYHNLKEDKDYYNQILANKLNPNFLYVKPYPSQRHDSSLIEIDKKDRKSRTIIRFEPTRIEYMVCNDICYSIPLVERMNGSLFARIDSIVDYEDKANNRFGHILLFNINGRPYYCTQPENQSLSEECSSNENLRALFEQCFTEELNPTDDQIWLILLILMIGIALLVIAIIVFICFKNKKTLIGVTTSHTSHDTKVSTRTLSKV